MHKSTDKRAVLQWILLGLTLLLIFTQSAMPPHLSSSESGFVVRILYPLLGQLLPPGADLEHFVRKAGHFTEYLILGIQVYPLWATVGKGQSVKQAESRESSFSLLKSLNQSKAILFVFSTIFLWLTAFLDETIQIFSGRGPQIQDVWLDLAGGLVGYLIGLGILSLYQKKKVQKQKETGI